MTRQGYGSIVLVVAGCLFMLPLALLLCFSVFSVVWLAAIGGEPPNIMYCLPGFIPISVCCVSLTLLLSVLGNFLNPEF